MPILFFFFFNLWLHWVFVAACGLFSSCSEPAGATLRCGARASYYGGFFCCGVQALGTQAQ